MRNKNAFTLVEIMTVLAILSLLAAIVFTVFGRVRESGRNTVCQSNQRQIFLAFQSYLQDNDSRFPSLNNWSESLEPYIKNQEIFLCPNVSQHNPYHPKVDYDVYPERINQVESSLEEPRQKGATEVSIPALTSWILLTDTGRGQEPDMVLLDYPATCSQKLLGHSGLGRNFPLVHRGGGNYLFADGHTKWLLPRTGMETDCAAGAFL